jgi:hypothetical protein
LSGKKTAKKTLKRAVAQHSGAFVWQKCAVLHCVLAEFRYAMVGITGPLLQIIKPLILADALAELNKVAEPTTTSTFHHVIQFISMEMHSV